MWNQFKQFQFQKLKESKILREINFGHFRVSKTAILLDLNFGFGEFCPWKFEKLSKPKIKSFNIVKMAVFKFSNNQNLFHVKSAGLPCFNFDFSKNLALKIAQFVPN